MDWLASVVLVLLALSGLFGLLYLLAVASGLYHE
jgi:hypothetical protein